MPEMIKYLTKKFSTHSLTEVKPAKKWTYNTGSSSRSEADSTKRFSSEKNNLAEDEDDEEISSITKKSAVQRTPTTASGGGGLKTSPKQMDHDETPAPSTSTTRKHITPPLRQFDMRLPDIEISERSTQYCPAIKPKKHLPAPRPSVRRVSALQDDHPRSSAFVRIPMIGTAKLHPRSDRLRSGSERRITMATTRKSDQESSSLSDSEVAGSEKIVPAVAPSPTTSSVQMIPGKKSPTPSLSILDRSSTLPHRLLNTPSPLQRFSPRTEPPLQPLKLIRSSPSPTELQKRITSDHHRVPSPPKFEYRCFTNMVTPGIPEVGETEKLASVLLEKEFVPILSKEERRRKEDSEGSRSVPLDKLLRLTSESPKRVGWSKGDVEMVDSSSPDHHSGSPNIAEHRASFHKERLNAAYTKDLKRKYSVMPVDEEVRNICAATSKSNFKAFILTSNPSQSGPNHRTIDISVVQPNKRVCCTDGTSPPLPRRPSINVEKMAQTVLLRRPVVRKAGNSNRVSWTTRSSDQEQRIRPIAIRPAVINRTPSTTVPRD